MVKKLWGEKVLSRILFCRKQHREPSEEEVHDIVDSKRYVDQVSTEEVTLAYLRGEEVIYPVCYCKIDMLSCFHIPS